LFQVTLCTSHPRQWKECKLYKCRRIIWGSHRGNYEEFCLLGYKAMHSFESQQKIRRNMSPPSSELKGKLSNQHKADSKQSLSASCRVFVFHNFRSWRCRWHTSPKRRFSFNELYDVIGNKIERYKCVHVYSLPSLLLHRWTLYRALSSHVRVVYVLGQCKTPNGLILFYYHFNTLSKIAHSLGRAVAQAISRWLPTATTRVRVRAACGACGGQSDTGAGFLRALRFPLPIIFPPISPSS
jgi:hypothetical protein